MEKIKPLEIGDLKIDIPVIQGGMGVRVSMSSLAAAAANAGCAGVIASVGLGDYKNSLGADYMELNRIALRDEIRSARRMSSGVIGVNAMVACTDYESLVGVCAEENVDMIVSGAGLPLHLPAYTAGTDIKLVPIVSSARSLQIICKKWKRSFNRIPDAVVVEGMMAGGHLGYSLEQLSNKRPPLEEILKEVLAFVSELPVPVPVIAAGGIFTGGQMARFLKMGASGVQMATRFVCTDECDADPAFKKAYLDARPEDLVFIKSPVGMPGRVINNDFVRAVNEGQRVPFQCKYHCLKTCSPSKVPYCIADVLARASEGEMENAFAFAGANACLCNEIVPVKQLVSDLVQEYYEALRLEGSKGPSSFVT